MLAFGSKIFFVYISKFLSIFFKFYFAATVVFMC